ncbi:MAG: DUF1598 domain-containing protein [Planctomycetaceae bacterium]
MLRKSNTQNVRTGKQRRRNSMLPVAVGIGCFAVVLAAVIVIANHNPAAKTAATVASASPQTVVADPSKGDANIAAANPVALQPAGPKSVVSESKSADTSAPAVAAVGDPAAHRELVAAHLAAGEFGPAIEIAHSTGDVAEKAALLQMVADAQTAAGEFASAATSIRGIPVGKRATKNEIERPATESLAGGSGADYGPLIDLIVEQTIGPWESKDGDGAQDPTEYDNGVRVDPNGLLYRLARAEQSGRLQALGNRARTADLNEDMSVSSRLRLVSLTRLEREISRRIAEGKPALETMKHLAGLSQIQHVFVYPETNEIVIGGRAEGWRFDESGAPVGIESGRPTLQLDDFVTVLRTFGPEGDGIFRCSINPRREGLANIRQFVAESNKRGPLNPGAVEGWTRQLEKQLGLQDIVVAGVPLESRVARVIVEADYRMKLIGIGKLDNSVGIPSYFDLLPPELQKNSPETTALRWWMTMKYDAVLYSPDRDVYEIQGNSVLCQSEDEMIAADGERVHTGKSEATNRLFAQNFTKSFAQLAAHDPIFGDLQNIFDLALVAALIRQDRLDEKTGWDRGVFAADGAYRPVEYDPPQSVMSVVNHRVYAGGNVVVQVAGGVRGDLMSVLTDGKLYKEAARLASVRDRGQAPKLSEGRWWWDAK